MHGYAEIWASRPVQLFEAARVIQLVTKARRPAMLTRFVFSPLSPRISPTRDEANMSARSYSFSSKRFRSILPPSTLHDCYSFTWQLIFIRLQAIVYLVDGTHCVTTCLTQPLSDSVVSFVVRALSALVRRRADERRCKQAVAGRWARREMAHCSVSALNKVHQKWITSSLLRSCSIMLTAISVARLLPSKNGGNIISSSKCCVY